MWFLCFEKALLNSFQVNVCKRRAKLRNYSFFRRLPPKHLVVNIEKVIPQKNSAIFNKFSAWICFTGLLSRLYWSASGPAWWGMFGHKLAKPAVTIIKFSGKVFHLTLANSNILKSRTPYKPLLRHSISRTLSPVHSEQNL